MPSVRLDVLGPEDLAFAETAFGEAEARRFTRVPEPLPDDFGAWWWGSWQERRRTGAEVFVARLADGTPAGLGMVPDLDAETREAELGYLVTPEHRGHGVATAIVRALTDWAFARGAQRVFLVIDVENPGSSRVAAKAGYTREGLMRSVAFKQGRRIDAELWSRLPSDP